MPRPLRTVCGISIHALREEGDILTCLIAFRISISIHALREEGDRRPCRRGGGDAVFLSTPSARRATEAYIKPLGLRLFLSTPSARRATGQLDKAGVNTDISIHALREEGDLRRVGEDHPHNISIHALREEGDDGPVGTAVVSDTISIHALREEGDAPNRG